MEVSITPIPHPYQTTIHDSSALTTWIDQQSRSQDGQQEARVGGLRFAFHGRVSTEDHQDPETSRAWQLLRAQALVSGYGRITVEYFDVGRSRTVLWSRRPEAGALLATLTDPDRGFDAVVIGSSERAFYGNQFTVMAPLFDHYNAPVWILELSGAAAPQTAGHEGLMFLLGILAKREVARARIRAHTSMTVQARDQGRYLGGHPPYGYRLVDAGPHPNRALARRGVRIQRLDPDPHTGPIVTWIFTQRLSRHSIARITRALNDMHIPCPSAADPERNQHRTAQRWNATAPHPPPSDAASTMGACPPHSPRRCGGLGAAACHAKGGRRCRKSVRSSPCRRSRRAAGDGSK
ncbi:hypothetical protein [Streptomyces sp. CT34]|uniref:hypothetical protein n=1 Tax=Streptomyces sp. CT34 TaxID=1553907 RepID=UPI0018E2B619|nr:hypothetical protein [Streptomyces sp. CT34]